MNEISKAPSFENNQCTNISSSSSSEHDNFEVTSVSSNEVEIPIVESSRFGKVNVEDSKNVHFGSCYNGPVRVRQIFHYPKDSLKILEKSSTEDAEPEEKKLNENDEITKFWTRKNLITTVAVSLILVTIAIGAAVTIYEIKNKSSPETESIISSTAVPTFTPSSTSDLPSSTTETEPNISSTVVPTFTPSSTSALPSSTTQTWDELPMIKRKDWGAASYSYERQKLKIPELVIISNRGVEQCVNKEKCVYFMKIFQEFDHDSLQLEDIDCNFFVGGDGNIYEGRGWDVVGQHTQGYDNKSLAVTLIGDFRDPQPDPTPKQIEAVKKLFEFAVGNYKIEEDYKLIGRNQADPKSTKPDLKIRNIIQSWEHWVKDPPC